MTIDPKYTNFEKTTEESISITNVQKHNWKSVNSRDFWRDVLSKIPEIWEEVLFNALSRENHSINVLELDSDSNELEGLLEKTQKLDLSLNKKQNKIQIGENRDYIDELNSLDDGKKAKKFELKGYPACCAEAMSKLGDKKIYDPVYEIACSSPSAEKFENKREKVLVKDPHPLLNVMWSYMNWQVINHYPCSFECDKSIEIAEKNFEIMKELGYESEAERLSGWLNSPMSWSGYHGLAHVKNGFSVGEYTSDERWSEKLVIWKEEHPPKAL